MQDNATKKILFLQGTRFTHTEYGTQIFNKKRSINNQVFLITDTSY